MKKRLIFIDNDEERQSASEINHVRHTLKRGGLESDYLNGMEKIFNFNTLDREEVYKVLFDPRNCIVSFSMYTAYHAGSLFQMQKFLKSAGNNNVKDVLYIDTSGMLKEALTNSLRDDDMRGVISILSAIENNYIITTQEKTLELVRLRVSIQDTFNIFTEESIDLNILTEEYTGKIPLFLTTRVRK